MSKDSIKRRSESNSDSLTGLYATALANALRAWG